MKIKNLQQLATTDQRLILLQIVNAGLEVIDTEAAIRRNVSLAGDELHLAGENYSLADIGRIIVIGAGKCSLAAARALEQILGDRISAGLVIDVREDPRPLKRISARAGDHPYPSEKNITYTRELLSLLTDLTPADLVINLVSGGGSTLLCQPFDGFTAAGEKELLELLFRGGASIQEINTMRKHLSQARGGFLAKQAYPARVVSLIFSDVPGDDLAFISSGPTVRDDTTVADALATISRYDPEEHFADIKNQLIETPKEPKYFERVKNCLIVSNQIALAAMATEAGRHNLKARVVTTRLTGDNREIASQILHTLRLEPAGTALFYGGETTVKIIGQGKGGRNRDLILSLFGQVAKDELITSIASDGRDNGESAGAFVDWELARLAEKKELNAEDYLINNDSDTFFRQLGYDIQTDATGANVADLVVALKF